MTGLAGTQTPLSAQLRAGTAEAHQAAEDTGFARELVGGERQLRDYIAMLGQLEHVYDALESAAAELAGHPQAGPFVDVRLHRLSALRDDLASLGGESAPALPGTAVYAARIADIARTWPVGWVAHHYTRYLGDLSGGQIMARAMQKAFGLEGRTGLTFFTFEGLGAPGAYKKGYRDRLDALGDTLDEADRQRLVDESSWAFAQNQALFVALAGLDEVSA